MQVDEDLDAYLEEFGDPVSLPETDKPEWGIFSQADREVLGGLAVAPDYMMVGRTDIFGDLANGVRLVALSGLCAGTYTVSGPARQIGDGAFCNVYLAKARP